MGFGKIVHSVGAVVPCPHFASIDHPLGERISDQFLGQMELCLVFLAHDLHLLKSCCVTHLRYLQQRI